MNGTRAERSLSVDALEPSLLEAKLGIPVLRRGVVGRDALIERARGSECRVVGVTAPAGYGKSTLLSQWAEAEDRLVVWVSLDRFDDDPGALLSLLAVAFGQATGRPNLVADVGGVSVSTLGRAAPHLASALLVSPVPFVLMLDDLHELRSPDCHDVLSLVISGIPRGSQLVTASRAEQPHLPRLRALGEAFEIEASDLALDAAGAARIFAQADLDVAPDVVAAVTARTEGWPAGLYLATLVPRVNGGQALAISGDDRLLADYLYREVLLQLPDDVQRFLRCTAVLDQLAAPLCDAVMEESCSGARLRHLEATSLFLVPLDRHREWYRYHELFREFLLGELRRVEPESVAKLHLRAADWYESNGSPSLALEHLLNTTERERCIQLVAALGTPTFQSGQTETVRRWLATLGDRAIADYPPLAVLAGWIAAVTGRTAQAQRWAAAIATATFEPVPADGSATFESARAMLRAALCADGPDQMAADANVAVAAEPPWSSWRAIALCLGAEAHLLLGATDPATGLLDEAAATEATLSNAPAVVLGRAERAALFMDEGSWVDAAAHIEAALRSIEAFRLQDSVLSLPAFAAAARLAVHRGDLDEADRQLARAMRARAASTFALPWLAVGLRLHLARTYAALAQEATARHLLREIEDILTHRPALGVLSDQVAELRRRLTADPAPGLGRTPLTPAELRLLPYLQTHLTFKEIGERLFVTRNTISSEVGSIYRKLGVSSRGGAVQRATAIGLLGA